MKLSIVMSTYNGEKYILEQLESLKNQTRKADEVIISDDCSKDSTNEIIENFIRNNKLSNWIHIRNKENQGWKKNFMDAINESTGDLIFTCDQDDVWYLNKLEHMEKIMSENDKINLLVSDYSLERGEKFIELNTDKIVKHKINKKFMFVYGPGCAFCFRKSLYDSAKNMWYEDYPHDAVLWRTAAITDSLYFYKVPLFYYRRHSETATGNEKKRIDTKIKSMEYYNIAIDKLKHFINNNKINDFKYKEKLILEEKIWINNRLKWLKYGKIIDLFKLISHIGYYYNIKSFLSDVLMVMNYKIRKRRKI